MFYTAKGDLDGYNNERKKVEDSSASEEVAHYKKLASQYLARYHKAQNAIKESYSAAKSHQTMYFQLSKLYHDLSEDANTIASKAEVMADALNKTQTKLAYLKVAHKKDLKILPGLLE